MYHILSRKWQLSCGNSRLVRYKRRNEVGCGSITQITANQKCGAGMALNNFCKWCSGCYYILSDKSFILWSIRAPNLNLNGIKTPKSWSDTKSPALYYRIYSIEPWKISHVNWCSLTFQLWIVERWCDYKVGPFFSHFSSYRYKIYANGLSSSPE